MKRLSLLLSVLLLAACATTPSWRDCTHASCWDGANANRRMMNILSPAFTDAKYNQYVAWMRGRGCDTAHVFLINQGDGEGAGYNCSTDPNAARLARNRIQQLRKKGMAVVVWLVADDSGKWAKDLFANADARVKAMADAGLFEDASYIVLGLEMDEYGSAADWSRLATALRRHWHGKVGVHHTSGNNFRYAGLGDIVLGQLDPKKATPSSIRSQVQAIRATGKEAVGFEYERHADRAKAQAALDAGAIGCGNW